MKKRCESGRKAPGIISRAAGNTNTTLFEGLVLLMQGKVEICGVNTATLPVLRGSETRQLLEQARAGDAAARERLISGNLRLVLSVVQKFAGRGESMDDLFQVGVIGLIKAVDAFDLSQNVQFSTYGVPANMGWRKAKANADPIAFGIFRTIRAPASSLFLAIHKVFLRKSAIAGTRILSKSALADRIVVCLKGVFSHDKKAGIGIGRSGPD
jgi:hypothetical protein